MIINYLKDSCLWNQKIDKEKICVHIKSDFCGKECIKGMVFCVNYKKKQRRDKRK